MICVPPVPDKDPADVRVLAVDLQVPVAVEPPGFGGGGPSPLYNIYFVDENVGFITGGRATILKTEDGGKTWSRKMAMSDTPGRDGNPGRLRANLMGIQMINETIGFIAGSENTILKTTDGGETWIGSSERARVGETRNNLENIWFVSPTTGWVIGSFGTLLHTADGGETWEKRDPGFDNNLFGIHFRDENTGWISGQEGLILHTTDGGATWNQQKNESYDDLHDITFVDAMVGWAVGGFNFRFAHHRWWSDMDDIEYTRKRESQGRSCYGCK